jgi:hypothetical protein
MASEARMIGYELLETGTLVSFCIVTEEVLNAPTDEAEFGLRLQLKFAPVEEEEDEDEVAEGIAEWGAFGFMFALGVLSFTGAKPRNMSELEYEEKDEFKLADFIELLRARRAVLWRRLHSRAPDQDPRCGTLERHGHARNDWSR